MDIENYTFYFVGGSCGSFVKRLFCYYYNNTHLTKINKITGDAHSSNIFLPKHYHFAKDIPANKSIVSVRFDRDDIDLICKMQYDKFAKDWLQKNWAKAQKIYDDLTEYERFEDMPVEVWYNNYKLSLKNWVEEQEWTKHHLVVEFKTILGLNDIDLNEQIASYFGKQPTTEAKEHIEEYRLINKKIYNFKSLKTLYTIGDSFTYGEELENISDNWPNVLAKYKNFNLINEAKPAVGNEYIIKKTMIAVEKYNPDLIIIGWTSCGRKEFADDLGAYDIWPGANGRKFNNNEHNFRLPLIDYITKYNNELHEYRTWLRQVVLLQSHLQVKNQPYLFCSTHDNQHRFGRFYNVCQDYYDLIDHDKFAGWPKDGMVEWTHGTPKGPRGHPLKEGHQKIAEEIAKYL